MDNSANVKILTKLQITQKLLNLQVGNINKKSSKMIRQIHWI